ncbi:MAG: cation:proton antiporter [Arcobacteraceae bacterium]|nr:cation:proton antiporter [Arcobacteraceae bacterium]
MDILTIIVITLTISLAINIVLKRYNISPIVGYIFTGAIITFFVDLSIIDSHYIEKVAEFGIVFLMFTIGLEFSIQHLKMMKKEVFVFGLLQVLFTATIFGMIAHYIFGLNTNTSVIIGAALSLSSTAIVLKILNETGDIHRPYGRNSLGILLFQDIAVIPILLMISFLSTRDDVSVGGLLLQTFLSGIFVLVILFLLEKYATTKFLSAVTKSKSNELFIAAIILIVLSASLLADYFGFSYSLGAFIAGMLIAETKFKHQIIADLIPFRDILLGLFFITVGLQINFTTILNNFFTIIALSIVILLLKSILIFLVVRIFTFTKRALKTAFTLAQIGEFSFVIFALAKSNSLIDSQVLQILVSVIVISLIFTSLFVRYVREFTNMLYNKKTETLESPIVTAEISHHIIVCGYSLLGQKIVKQLRKKDLPYMVVDSDQTLVERGDFNGDVVFFGNAASKTILESMFLKNAMAVIIAIDNDDKVRLICEAIKSIRPDIHIIVKISHQSQVDDLVELGVEDFVNENESVAKLLVSKAMKCDLV